MSYPRGNRVSNQYGRRSGAARRHERIGHRTRAPHRDAVATRRCGHPCRQDRFGRQSVRQVGSHDPLDEFLRIMRRSGIQCDIGAVMIAAAGVVHHARHVPDHADAVRATCAVHAFRRRNTAARERNGRRTAYRQKVDRREQQRYVPFRTHRFLQIRLHDSSAFVHASASRRAVASSIP